MDNKSLESVFIFGCGYLGTQLAIRLLNQGHKVGALTKNQTTAEDLKARGVSEVIVSELESEKWHSKIASSYNRVVNCVSSSGGGLEGYEKSYLQGQSSILKWAQGQTIDQYIYTSSTSVYSEDQGGVVDEDSGLVDSLSSPTGSIIRQSEALIESAQGSFDHYHILRLSGIYGPNRHYLLNQLLENKVIPGDGELLMNMIHVADVVSVIISIIEGNPLIQSGIYNLSDDAPTAKRQVAEWICEKLNSPSPEFNRELQSGRNLSRKSRTKNRKISNKKLRKSIDLKYPSFVQGYQEILKDIAN